MTVSVILELENVRGDEVAALGRLCDVLVRQGGDRIAELVVSVPIGQRSQVARTLEGLGLPSGWTIRLIEVEPGDYTLAKAAASAEATGDVLVFVDSDVAPQDGWFDGLLREIEGGADAVAGGTYVAPGTDVVALSFAAFWIFRTGPEARLPTTGIPVYANNFAVRREVNRAHGFVARAGAFRTDEFAMRDAMIEAGHRVAWAPEAIAIHPMPSTLPGRIERIAAAAGDGVRFAAGRGTTPGQQWLRLPRELARLGARCWWNLARGRAGFAVAPWRRAVAGLLLPVWWGAYVLGFVRAWRDLAQRA